MRVAVCPVYGPPEVFVIEDRPVPQVKPGMVLVRVHATAATSGDARIRGARFPKGMDLLAKLALGFSGPRQPVLGGVFAGEVTAVGPDVATFKPGDRVFGMTGAAMGCYAEYVQVKAGAAIATIPPELGFETAAALPFGGNTAFSYLRDKAQLRPAETVLVIGASGDVGSAAVQIARHLGARVTGLCSTRNLEHVQSLGADNVIDYTQKNAFDGQQKYDVVFDMVGTTPVDQLLNAVAPNGRLLLGVAGLRDMLRRKGPQGQRIISGVASEKASDLALLAKLTTQGTFKPTINRVFRFDDLGQAHALVDSGRKVGSAVISIP